VRVVSGSKEPPAHGGNRGSNPLGDAIFCAEFAHLATKLPQLFPDKRCGGRVPQAIAET